MTIGAIRSEFVVVHIGMAGSTGIEFDAGKLLKLLVVFYLCLMAFFAGHILMFTQ